MSNLKANPWYKSTLSWDWGGKHFQFAVPHEVFSTQKIDDGTLLLLGHLPSRPPERVLDLGCGYGALGLPVAALHRNAEVHLVDRDLLAVEWAQKNADQHALENVRCFGSLGFSNLQDSGSYDWILCNVPARIGSPFIKNLLLESRCRLGTEGELRIVVIPDLIAVAEAAAQSLGWPVQQVIPGARHSVLVWRGGREGASPDDPDLYLRDQVQIEGMTLDRPFDLGGDDPKRLAFALPLLAETLPRQTLPERVFIHRTAYGAVPALCRLRWPNSQITTWDRDLLAIEYSRRNLSRLEGTLRTHLLQAPHLAAVSVEPGEMDLITYEVSPSAGEAVAHSELHLLRDRLRPGGSAIILAFDRVAKEWLGPERQKNLPRLVRIAGRNGFVVYQLTRG